MAMRPSVVERVHNRIHPRGAHCHAPLLLFFLACVSLLAQGAAAPADLDAWVARAMKTFEVPGLAVAIVKDDTVVVAKGYGVRKLGEAAPVDARTLFGIASNTKVFTATALGPARRRGQDRVGRAGHPLSVRRSRCGIRTSRAS